MGWREDIKVGILRADQIFLGIGNGIESSLGQVSGRATLAQLNAGLVIAAAQPGRAYRPLLVRMRAIGGAVTTCTLVRIMNDTNVVLSNTQASMVQDLWVNEATSGAVSTNINVTGGVNKSLTLDKTGTAATVVTHIDYVVLYQLIVSNLGAN